MSAILVFDALVSVYVGTLVILQERYHEESSNQNIHIYTQILVLQNRLKFKAFYHGKKTASKG
jgi:hypothetical protein